MTGELTRTIRNLCNHPWKRELLFQDKVRWNKLWMSIDAIDDTSNAIEFYCNSLTDFDANSGGYLYIYGIMQALNIQQDATNNLSIALFNKKIDFKVEYPELYDIREHRNNSVGHPTNRSNERSFHLIGRNSISKPGFTLASYFPKTGEKSKFEEIDIINCINTQQTLVSTILREVMSKLQSDFEAHKIKFKGQKLSSLIHNDFHYEFSKLYSHVFDDYPLVKMSFDLIFNAYGKIKQGIVDRYFAISALSGINDTVKTLDYIFDRLQRNLIESKIEDQIELIIFVEALEHHFKEFGEMIAEIDQEFD